MKLAAIFLMSFAFNSYAQQECATIPSIQIKMDAHGSNYQNADTTRTPNGGAYKYQEVICQKNCKIIESENFIQKYNPNHPDADENGYVSYPYIDKKVEKAFLSAYAKSLVMISKVCPMEIKGLETKNGSAILMRYTTGDILSDTINFRTDGDVVSWVRETKNGKSKLINF